MDVGRERYLGIFDENFDTLWKTKGSKKWRRSKFRVYCLRNKILANFVNRVLGDTTQPFHIAFGAAKFAATGKGEHFASPCSSFGEQLKEQAGAGRFSLIDEWNTSKVCHRCLEPLQTVGYYETRIKNRGSGSSMNEEGKEEEEEEEEDDSDDEERRLIRLRGLRRCYSAKSYQNNSDVVPQCPIAGSFVDRDSNAATNIAKKFLLQNASKLIGSNLNRGVKVKGKERTFLLNRQTQIKTTPCDDRGVVVRPLMQKSIRAV